MKSGRGLLLVGIVILLGVATVYSLYCRPEAVTGLNTETLIPIEVSPGEDASLGGFVDAGQSLQQPGAYSGQDNGAAGLQDAATFSPDELNAAEF